MYFETKKKYFEKCPLLFIILTVFYKGVNINVIAFKMVNIYLCLLLGVCVCVCVCVCVFGFNVAFNKFSVISRRCLVATGSSMLTFIVLPH